VLEAVACLRYLIDKKGEGKMPIPERLRTELGHYQIGQKLKALRLRRSMGLVQLGERTGLSSALLSKIENSKLVPTLPTLLRIATVFDVSLDHFFQNDYRQRVISITRREDREQSFVCEPKDADHYQLTRLDLGSGDRKFQPYLAEFFPENGANSKAHMHQGFEFIHILRGMLQLVIGTDESVLRPGDSIYFDSNIRHSYRRLGQDKCMAFMVFAYPERNLSERRMDRLEGVHAVRRQPQASSACNSQLARRPALNGRSNTKALFNLPESRASARVDHEQSTLNVR
jgi:transcriptional regulator with XRE-family HTH domain